MALLVKKRNILVGLLLMFTVLFGAIRYPPVTANAAEPQGDASITKPFDVSISDDGTLTVRSTGDADMEGITDLYKNVCAFIFGILTITMILFMVLQFTKLGAAGDNPQARSRAIAGILTTAIATALLGSASIWFAFFYNAFSGSSGTIT